MPFSSSSIRSIRPISTQLAPGRQRSHRRPGPEVGDGVCRRYEVVLRIDPGARFLLAIEPQLEQGVRRRRAGPRRCQGSRRPEPASQRRCLAAKLECAFVVGSIGSSCEGHDARRPDITAASTPHHRRRSGATTGRAASGGRSGRWLLPEGAAGVQSSPISRSRESTPLRFDRGIDSGPGSRSIPMNISNSMSDYLRLSGGLRSFETMMTPDSSSLRSRRWFDEDRFPTELLVELRKDDRSPPSAAGTGGSKASGQADYGDTALPSTRVLASRLDLSHDIIISVDRARGRGCPTAGVRVAAPRVSRHARAAGRDIGATTLKQPPRVPIEASRTAPGRNCSRARYGSQLPSPGPDSRRRASV